MGGFGSGRYGGRATVEGCRSLKLDVNKVVAPAVRSAVRQLGGEEVVRYGPITWTWTTMGYPRPWARVEVTLLLGRERGFARLEYNVDHGSSPTGPQNQAVEMISTECRFGGRQWWWVCPANRRRCAKL